MNLLLQARSHLPHRSTTALMSVVCLLLVTACKPGSLEPTRHYAQVDVAHGGTVTGVVHFSKMPPPPIEIDMAQDPVCAMSSADMTADYVVNHGGLANVVVYVQSGLGDRVYAIPREPVVIDQKGCRFVPHVSVAMTGQQVEFLNSDNTQHNVHMSPAAAGNEAFDVTQRAGASPYSRNFRAPENMMAVRCNNHPWMHSYLSVVPSPFSAVSDADGRFTIRGLPPGTYTFAAVHEQLGQRSARVTVPAGGTVPLGFTF